MNNLSKLKLHPLVIRNENKTFILEDTITNEFFEMPALCVEAIELMMEGWSLGEIERELKVKYPSEEVDLLEFADQLLEMDLVDEIDGVKIERTAVKQEVSGFQWISPRVAKLFFNKYMNRGYFLLFLLNIILFVYDSKLIPHYQDIFVFDMMMKNILMWMLISGVLLFIHEYGHIMAIRSHGFPTRLEVGHRLFLVVLETDLTAAWKLQAKQRNVLYLAGLSFDQVILTSALIGQVLLPESSKLLLGVLGFVVVDVVIRMIYQCCIYLKTDLYFVLENMSGNYNLMENARVYFKNILGLKNDDQAGSLRKSEKRFLFVYGLFHYVGIGITLLVASYFYVPQFLFTVRFILPKFSEPINSHGFWDAMFVTLQLGIFLALLLFAWKKKYRGNRKQGELQG